MLLGLETCTQSAPLAVSVLIPFLMAGCFRGGFRKQGWHDASMGQLDMPQACYCSFLRAAATELMWLIFCDGPAILNAPLLETYLLGVD